MKKEGKEGRKECSIVYRPVSKALNVSLISLDPDLPTISKTVTSFLEAISGSAPCRSKMPAATL
tara:strand:- start:1671 stop:1862 length:192 start_codon:yes stop_codon:yes gene_type:complete